MKLINPCSGGGASSGTTIDAYCYVDATSGTPTIQKSSNVSSITDSGVGDYIVNFTTALASTNYCVSGMTENAGGLSAPRVVFEKGSVARTTTSCAILVAASSSNTARDEKFSFIVTGA